MKLQSLSVLCALAITVSGGAANAAGDPVRVRGTIVSLEGSKLVVHGRDGKDVTVVLAEKAGVAAVVKASIADIKPGVFIGTATTDNADATLRSVEVVVFPAAMNGTGEGHYPWDLPGANKMTNATVTQDVKGVDGQTVTVAYKGGEKKIQIPANVPIVTLAPGSLADLHAGEAVFVPGLRQADGSVQASRVLYGKDGVTPPM
ncbi:MAG: hypothetical protein KGM15_04480 [Pseudomonadota bacterium]|nr:hypothetical protein [Pseudomonadota bacterium]